MATTGGVEELLGKKRGKKGQKKRGYWRGLREEVKERAALDRGSIEHRVLNKERGV